MSAQTTSNKVLRNTIFSNIGYAWGLIISLLLTPFIISHIGVAQYGLFVLVESVFGLFSLLDIAGIGGAFVKYISESHAKGDNDRVNRIVALGFAYYTFFWLIVCSAALIFKSPILGFFKITPTDRHFASVVYVGILAITLLQGSLAVFRSVLLGLQRLDITNQISMVMGIANALGIVVALSLGYGLSGLIMASVATAIITQAAQTFFAFNVLPSLRRMRLSFDRGLFLETFRYGMQIQVARITEILGARIDKFLVGHFLTVDLVGFYELGSKLAAVARSLAMQLMPAIVPAASELEATTGREPVLRLYYRTTKYAALLSFPMVAFVSAFPAPILTLWLGKTGFGSSALALRVLAAGTLIATIANAGRLVARGMGIPSFEMQACIVTMVLNLVLSTVFIMLYGFPGALLGTALSSTIGALFFLIRFHRHIREGLFRVLIIHYLAPPTIASLLAVGAAKFAAILLHCGAADRLQAGLTVGIFGVISLAIYAVVLFAARFIDKTDIETAKRTMAIVRLMLPGTKAQRAQ
jgi:O-antigen/teichoic acid export membrane protein